MAWGVFAAEWFFVVVGVAAVVVFRRRSTRFRIASGYVIGSVLVLLGLPLFLGNLGAIFPLVIGAALIARSHRLSGSPLRGHS